MNFASATLKTQLTMLAAIQLVMMQTMTSLTPSIALNMPGIKPHSTPASMPATNASIHTTAAGTL